MAYVLSHQHDGIKRSELDSDCVDLFAADVVAVNQDGLLVLVSQAVEFVPVLLLLDSLFGLLLFSHSMDELVTRFILVVLPKINNEY
jgi:hypothetical protein